MEPAAMKHAIDPKVDCVFKAIFGSGSIKFCVGYRA